MVLARRLAPLIDRDWSDWLPTFAYAIEHPDGVVLVDSGASAGLMRLPRWHPYFRFAVHFAVEPEQEAAPQLKALGIGVRDVKRIVLTHMHIDHDGGLSGFPMSQVLVAPGELRTASGFSGKMRGYLPQRWPSGFDPAPLALEDIAYGPFVRSRRLTADGAVVAVATPVIPSTTSASLSRTAMRRSSSRATPPTRETAMLAGALDGVSPDEAVASATLAAIRAFAARARRSTCRRTIRTPRVGSPSGKRSRPPVRSIHHRMRGLARCAAAAAALGDRSSASSGKAASDTSVMSRKSLE